MFTIRSWQTLISMTLLCVVCVSCEDAPASGDAALETTQAPKARNTGLATTGRPASSSVMPDLIQHPSPSLSSAKRESDLCVDCHPDAVEAFHRTGMGRALYRPQGAPMIENFDVGAATVAHGRMPAVYRAYVDEDGRWWQSETVPGTDYERAVEVAYVIGSGNATRSYLGYVDDELVQLPLTWYSGKKIWDMSPGYEGRGHMRFMRTVGPECLFCHNGFTPHEAHTDAKYTTPLTEGITCSRCHGDASEHVRQRLSGEGPPVGQADASILNPARLSKTRGYEVCQQCHLQGVVRLLHDGRHWDDYSPREPLANYLSVYRLSGKADDFDIASQGTRLLLSRCAKLTPGGLSCSQCHDIHAHQETKANDACQTCHLERRCSIAAGRTGDADCAGCHMAKGPVSDIPHVQFTDHYIRKKPGRRAPLAERLSGLKRLHTRPLDTLIDQKGLWSDLRRSLADVVYALQGDRQLHRLEFALARLESMLNTESAAGQAQPPTGLLQEGWSSVGQAYVALGKTDQAVRAYRRRATLGPLPLNDAEHYVYSLIDNGDVPKAIAQARRLADRYPREGMSWALLGMTLNAGGQFGAAEDAYARATKRLPTDSSIALSRGMNAFADGQAESASTHWKRALDLDPLNTSARVQMIKFHEANQNFAASRQLMNDGLRLFPRNGHLLLTVAQAAAAEEPYRDVVSRYNAAISADPMILEAYIDLYRLALKQGLPEDARDAIDRGAVAFPDYPGWASMMKPLGPRPKSRR